MDFVVSTCILHFIVQVKCKNSEALTITTQSDTHYTQLQRSVQSGGGGGGGGGHQVVPPASYPPCYQNRLDSTTEHHGPQGTTELHNILINMQTCKSNLNVCLCKEVTITGLPTLTILV